MALLARFANGEGFACGTGGEDDEEKLRLLKASSRPPAALWPMWVGDRRGGDWKPPNEPLEECWCCG